MVYNRGVGVAPSALLRHTLPPSPWYTGGRIPVPLSGGIEV